MEHAKAPCYGLERSGGDRADQHRVRQSLPETRYRQPGRPLGVESNGGQRRSYDHRAASAQAFRQALGACV
jgi:hypothetical protein